jgi:hypothetical protein
MPATLTESRPTLLEQHAQEHLVTRMATRYAGTYAAAWVRGAVAEAYEQFAGARIRVYVPLLAERIVRERLGAAHERESPGYGA